MHPQFQKSKQLYQKSKTLLQIKGKPRLRIRKTIKKKSRMERVTLPVSVSLMRRTSRVFWKTTILYSHVFAQGFTISICSFSIANFPILGKNLKDYSKIRIIVLEIKPRTNEYHKNKIPPF